MKSKWNLPAAAMMALTVASRKFAGEPSIWQPVYQSELTEMVRVSMGLVWHGLTLVFVIMTALSLIAYFKPVYSAGINISLLPIHVAFTGFALMYGLLETGNIWVLPQWILFLPMVVFTSMALRAALKEKV